MSYFELATAVCDEPSPELPPDKPFSPQLRDFLRLCLHKDPAVRPSAASLLAHPLLLRVARTPSSGSSSIQAAAAERPASPYGSKLQRGQLAKRELHQIADALAAHFGGGIGSSGRRSSGLVRVSSSCAGPLSQAGLGVSASASGHGALGVSGSGTHAHGGPCGGLPSITAKQLRRLAENLKLDQTAVREALQDRLQGLVVLEGGGGGDPTASGFSTAAHVVVVDGGGGTLHRSLSSSSLALGLSGSMQHQHQHQHQHQASSMSPTRRMSSLMRRSSAGGSTGTGPEGAGAAGSSSSLAPIQDGKRKDWAGRRTASAAGGIDDRQQPGGVGCCHMM